MPEFACNNCHAPMLYIQHNRNPYCIAPACQRARVQVDILQPAVVAKRTIEELGKKHLKANGSEITPALKLAVLPANNMDLVELPNKRKEDFLAHIRLIYRDVQQQAPDAHEAYNRELEPEDSEHIKDLLGKACATCKGHCCGLGSIHAFQDYWSLQLFLQDNENLGEDEVAELSASFLPEKSYESACVFQGNKGCAVPSEMRAITCRNFKYRGLSDYQLNIEKDKPNLTVAGAVNGRNVLTIAVFSEAEFSYIDR